MCVYSVPDLGELLQCALGDTDPGCFHCGEAAGPCSHHCSGNSPDCQRCVCMWLSIHFADIFLPAVVFHETYSDILFSLKKRGFVLLKSMQYTEPKSINVQ